MALWLLYYYYMIELVFYKMNIFSLNPWKEKTIHSMILLIIGNLTEIAKSSCIEKKYGKLDKRLARGDFASQRPTTICIREVHWNRTSNKKQEKMAPMAQKYIISNLLCKYIHVYKFRTMHPFAEYLQEYIVTKHGYSSKHSA